MIKKFSREIVSHLSNLLKFSAIKRLHYIVYLKVQYIELLCHWILQ